LTQNLALLFPHDRPRAVVRIDDLVADVEQEGLPDVGVRRLHEKEPAASSCRRSGHIIARSSQAINGTATAPSSSGGGLLASRRLLEAGPERLPQRLHGHDARRRSRRAPARGNNRLDAQLGALVEAPVSL